MSRLLGAAKVVLALILVLVPWAFLGTALSLVVDIMIVVLLVLLDARRHRLVSIMAIRYALRRPATTALVVGGLLVGTAIVSATFVVSDTLDNLIVGQVTENLADVDLVVASEFGSIYVYIDDGKLDTLVTNLTALDGVDHVSPAVTESAVIFNTASGLYSLSNTALGLSEGSMDDLGGVMSRGSPIETGPGSGGIYITRELAMDIDATEGDLLLLVRGNASLPLQVERIIDREGLGAYSLDGGGFYVSPMVLVNRTDLQMWTGNPGRSNLMFITLDDPVAFDRSELEDVLKTSGIPGLEVVQDRQEILDDGQDNMSSFTSLFFVFGSFSVIAGMALVLNIFTMLGEERKSEMGITRAVGLPRSGLRRLFTYEGVVYATMASGVGTVLGIVVAYLIIYSISGVFGFTDINILSYFTYTPEGLAISYLIGFAITMGTVYFATMRISRMNIVRAIRAIPDPPVPTRDRRAFLIGVGMLVIGILMTGAGMAVENLGLSMSGLSLGTLSAGLLLRRYLGDRLAWNAAALSTLAIWVSGVAGIQLFPYSVEIEMLVVAGLFLLISSLLLVMFNSDSIIWLFTGIIRARSSYRAVVRTAISYPLKAKFRTGLSIFIFGLVIFTVTILTMISGVMNYNIPIMVEETSGGFDTIAFTLDSRTVLDSDPWAKLNSTDGFLDGSNVSNLLAIASIEVRLNDTVDIGNGELRHIEYSILALGVNERFYTEGYYPLAEWDTSRFSSEREAWEGVMSNRSLVIIDGGLAGAMGGMMSFNDVERIVLNDTFRVEAYDGTFSNLTVVGVMKQSALGGIFVSEGAVYDTFKALGPNRMLISYAEGLDPAEQSVLLEKDFVDAGLTTISVKALAEQITSSVNSIFTLFRAFLAMGLVIGIAGLGIITIRAIYERRLEIGMMRAIGFTKRMVIVNFALESAFISMLGIVAGSLLGILVGYQLYVEALRSLDFVFVIDWQPILLVAVLAFLATMLSILPAASGASKVAPAEVLRFE